MTDLLDSAPGAIIWLNGAIQRHSGSVFGRLLSAVIWSDARGEDGRLLVPVDPLRLVDRINSQPHILLLGHDPGKPIGQVLEAANFETEDGSRFVAAVLGYYAGGDILAFGDLGLDLRELALPPATLPALPENGWIQLGADPKEVPTAWLDAIANDSPLQINRTELSHNAADATQELIRVGLIFLAVVWSPFITSIASEAGKNTYAAIHKWIRKLLEQLAERRNPILDIYTFQDGCQISFLVRGKDIKQHYVAHDALPNAAAQAARLVEKLNARGMPARQLAYEFDRESALWFPSYAILKDGRIITENSALIAIENLPTGLSLGLSRGESLIPTTRPDLRIDKK